MPTSHNNESIEFDIQAYAIVTASGVSCGIEEIVNEVLDLGELDYLFHAVKIKLMRRECDDIPKLLFDSLNESCISRLSMMSSPTEAYLFEQEMKNKILNFNNRLLSYPSPTSENVNVDRNTFPKCASNASSSSCLGISINALRPVN